MSSSSLVVAPDDTRTVQCANAGDVTTYIWNASGDTKGTAFCVHGTARNAHDFDAIATRMQAQGYRVVAVDLPGRGATPLLEDKSLYGDELYLSVCVDVVNAVVGAEGRFHWIGMSLGGHLGILAAAGPLRERIASLTLNDIGPSVSKDGLNRIRKYLSRDISKEFDDISGAIGFFQVLYADQFGAVDEAFWSHMAESYCPVNEGTGKRTFSWAKELWNVVEAKHLGDKEEYDEDVEVWDTWAKVGCPVLLLKGAKSDVVSEDTLERMRSDPRGDAASLQVVVFEGVGHMPPCWNDETGIAAVQAFVLAQASC